MPSIVTPNLSNPSITASLASKGTAAKGRSPGSGFLPSHRDTHCLFRMLICDTGLVIFPVYSTEFSGKHKLCIQKNFAEELTNMPN